MWGQKPRSLKEAPLGRLTSTENRGIRPVTGTQMAGAANYEASRPAKASSAGRRMDPSEPQPLLRWGRLDSGDHSQVRRTERRSRRSDARATPGRTSCRSRALPQLPNQASGSQRPCTSPEALPHPNHQTPPCPRRWLSCPARLTSHVEYDTWKSRTPDTDPHPLLGARNYKSQKAGGWPRPFPTHASGAGPGFADCDAEGCCFTLASACSLFFEVRG